MSAFAQKDPIRTWDQDVFHPLFYQALTILMLLISGCGASNTTSPTTGAGGSTCTSNASPSFTSAIVNPSDVLVVIPPGLLTSLQPKGHSYIRSNVASASSPVRAPVNMTLKKFVYYDSGVSDGAGGTYPIYILDFDVSCEVSIWIDHVYQAVSSITALAPASPSPSTDSQYAVTTNISFNAGDLIGYSQPYQFDPTKSQIDFGVRSTAASNTILNTTNAPEKIRYSLCPYDFYTAGLKSQYSALYGDSSPVSGGLCRSVAIDVVGTISGYWYSAISSGTGAGPYDGYLGIGLKVDTSKFLLGGLKNGEFSGSLGASATPTSVTVGQEVCYTDGSSHVFFKLISNTQLQVAFRDSDPTCPGSFPSSSTGYTLYETYAR